MKLSELKPGEHGVVLGLDPWVFPETDRGTGARLRDLGLTDGTDVTCVMHSPLGDPMAYRFRGTVIAMRKKDAEGVLLHG